MDFTFDNPFDDVFTDPNAIATQPAAVQPVQQPVAPIQVAPVAVAPIPQQEVPVVQHPATLGGASVTQPANPALGQTPMQIPGQIPITSTLPTQQFPSMLNSGSNPALGPQTAQVNNMTSGAFQPNFGLNQNPSSLQPGQNPTVTPVATTAQPVQSVQPAQPVQTPQPGQTLAQTPAFSGIPATGANAAAAGPGPDASNPNDMWREAKAPNGRIYFYKKSTRETTWTKPAWYIPLGGTTPVSSTGAAGPAATPAATGAAPVANTPLTGFNLSGLANPTPATTTPTATTVNENPALGAVGANPALGGGANIALGTNPALGGVNPALGTNPAFGANPALGGPTTSPFGGANPAFGTNSSSNPALGSSNPALGSSNPAIANAGDATSGSSTPAGGISPSPTPTIVPTPNPMLSGPSTGLAGLNLGMNPMLFNPALGGGSAPGLVSTGSTSALNANPAANPALVGSTSNPALAGSNPALGSSGTPNPTLSASNASLGSSSQSLGAPSNPALLTGGSPSSQPQNTLDINGMNAQQQVQYDPVTGQPINQQIQYDPATGQPIAHQHLQYDPVTGQPIQTPPQDSQIQYDPVTGQPITSQAQYDPVTGQYLGGGVDANGQALGYDANGMPIQSNTPQVVYDASGQVMYDAHGQVMYHGMTFDPASGQYYPTPQQQPVTADTPHFNPAQQLAQAGANAAAASASSSAPSTPSIKTLKVRLPNDQRQVVPFKPEVTLRSVLSKICGSRGISIDDYLAKDRSGMDINLDRTLGDIGQEEISFLTTRPGVVPQDETKRKAHKIMSDIYEANAGLSSSLQAIIKNYRDPLLKSAQDVDMRKRLLSEQECNQIFASIESITSMTKEFMTHLSSQLSIWPVDLTEMIQRHSEVLTFYNDFVNNYRQNMNKLEDLRRNPDFSAFVDGVQRSLGARLRLEDFMALPAVKISATSTLVEALVGVLTEQHPNYLMLREFHQRLAPIANQATALRLQMEARSKIVSLETNIAKFPKKGSFLHDQRIFFRDGVFEMTIKKKPTLVYVALFTDLMIVCRAPEKKKKDKPATPPTFEEVIPFGSTGCTVEEVGSQGWNLHIDAGKGKVTYNCTIHTSSELSKADWVKAFKDAFHDFSGKPHLKPPVL